MAAGEAGGHWTISLVLVPAAVHVSAFVFRMSVHMRPKGVQWGVNRREKGMTGPWGLSRSPSMVPEPSREDRARWSRYLEEGKCMHRTQGGEQPSSQQSRPLRRGRRRQQKAPCASSPVANPDTHEGPLLHHPLHHSSKGSLILQLPLTEMAVQFC